MKYLWLLLFFPVVIVLGASQASRERIVRIPMGNPRPESGISCDGKKPQLVRVAYGRVTVINFPFKPKNVVPGEVSFDFKQIKNDLVIKALGRSAKTNLMVYLEDRRCAFELVSVQGRADDILIVRDSKDDQIEVPFYD